MLDLGGGLGTYSIAWVESRPTRTATIVDLPHLQRFFDDALKHANHRLSFKGADLTKPLTIPADVDFVLFANVLHLVPDWQRLLADTVDQGQDSCLVGIFEADPNTAQGMLFDVQVHLRSGRVTGLLEPTTLAKTMTNVGLKDVRRLSTDDPEDPFQRTCSLWLEAIRR